MCGENFQIYGVHIPRKCIDSRRFYSCPSPFKTRPLPPPPPNFLSSRPRQKESTHSLRQDSFENLFPPKQKGEDETMICSIKVQSENVKMTLNIRFFVFCMICNFFKYDGFTVLKIISII